MIQIRDPNTLILHTFTIQMGNALFGVDGRGLFCIGLLVLFPIVANIL